MTIHECFSFINTALGTPTALLFLAVGAYFTFYTKCMQIRALPRFFSLLFSGVKQQYKTPQERAHRMSPWRAVFTAMATTIGMGNVVGPSVAIISGGPGALFWLIVYMFIGSVIKYAEVLAAISTRVKYLDGRVIGGPMEYLKLVAPWIAAWYSTLIMVLLISWSSVQSNTLAHIFAFESVPNIIIGILLAILIYFVILGGAARIGAVASALVPIMFVCYITFAGLILLQHPYQVLEAIKLIFAHIFSPLRAGLMRFLLLLLKLKYHDTRRDELLETP